MAPSPVAVAIIGRAVPAWVRDLPPGSVETHLIDPGSSPTVEAGLNQALARTRARLMLPVQEDDQIRPVGLLAMADLLERRPRAIGAVAPADQVRRNGALRLTDAAPADDRSTLLGLSRISTPPLLRTEPLRAAGGWRPGDALWHRRPFRHRPLLARLLARGPLIAAAEPLGVIALARPCATNDAFAMPSVAPDLPATPATMRQALERLLYRPVAITGVGGDRPVRGRVAALHGDLLTLATEGGGLLLIRLSEIQAVEVLAMAPPGRFTSS